MTPAVLAFVQVLKLSGKCLDVGAFDVNGNIRDLFPDYTGLDMRPGPNVDVVAPGNALPFPDDAFDVVTCLETLEHDRDPFGTVREMRRVLKPGGALVLTVPSISFHRHEYPADYWRMTAQGVAVLLEGMDPTMIREDADHTYSVGFKPAPGGSN
jgi:SAM-dependent methyltransferase